MISFALFLTTLLLLRPSVAAWTLVDDYAGQDFFDAFTFFTDEDPTHGNVTFADKSTANKDGLAGVLTNVGDSVYLGVDWKSTATRDFPRSSVRLTSKKSYNKGLFVTDLLHMPSSICGVWPAYWFLGAGAVWPNHGEIDVLEGVNDQVGNHMTLHTSPGCKVASSSNITNTPAKFTGKLSTTNCDIDAPGQDKNAGCQISNDDPKSYGTGFNLAGGGVYAVLWTSSEIAIYFFSRDAIPADLASNSTSPDPSRWPTPAARFSAGPDNCDIDSHFKNQQIVFSTTFCGDWAGKVWDKSDCAKQAPTCADFVNANPGKFYDAYWAIRYLRVYAEAK